MCSRGVLKQPLNDRSEDGTLWDWNIYLDVGQICGKMYANKSYTHGAFWVHEFLDPSSHGPPFRRRV